MTGRFDGYGLSCTGRNHMRKGLPCQDSHCLVRGKVWQLVAVADGVGSAPCADIGAKEALCALTTTCQEPIVDALQTLEAGFVCALLRLERLAHAQGRPVQDYDTTMTACLYDGETVCIGHVGDSGAIGVDAQGRYQRLTQVQKGDAWNEVYPLRAGSAQWVFVQPKGMYSAIALFTDGLLDQVCPSLLSGQPDPIYRRFASLFLPKDTRLSGEQIRMDISRLLAREEFDHLSDDLTAAAVWHRERPMILPEPDYLQEPDWEALRKARYHKLYPHLKPKEELSDDITRRYQ